MIKTQKEIVLDLIKELGPVRTEVLKREAMRHGISCPDRYARYLQREGRIFSFKVAGDKTKTWAMREEIPSGLILKEEEGGQLSMYPVTER